jgi:hypothetical protein
VQWSDLQFSPTDRTLRQFSGIFLAVFGLLSVLEATVRHRPVLALIYAVLAAVIGPVGLVWPQLVKPVYVGWSVLAFPIGWCISTVMLAILFYGVFTPVGLMFRLFGRDILVRRRPAVNTYWRPKPAPRDPREYFRQS